MARRPYQHEAATTIIRSGFLFAEERAKEQKHGI